MGLILVSVLFESISDVSVGKLLVFGAHGDCGLAYRWLWLVEDSLRSKLSVVVHSPDLFKLVSYLMSVYILRQAAAILGLQG